jgi:hypothetical protein
MPEATVDEHRDAPSREHDVGPTPKALQRRGMLAKPQAQAMESGAKVSLYLALRAIGEHHVASPCRGRCRRRRYGWDLVELSIDL